MTIDYIVTFIASVLVGILGTIALVLLGLWLQTCHIRSINSSDYAKGLHIQIGKEWRV